MRYDKIDLGRMGEYYMPDHGGIADALLKKSEPVYVIYRHGFYKRFLSRSAAIDNLARIMATKVFKRMGLPIRENEIYDSERQVWIIGELSSNYICCRERAKRRILRLLAKLREIEKWQKEYDNWSSKHKELMKRRPF